MTMSRRAPDCSRRWYHAGTEDKRIFITKFSQTGARLLAKVIVRYNSGSERSDFKARVVRCQLARLRRDKERVGQKPHHPLAFATKLSGTRSSHSFCTVPEAVHTGHPDGKTTRSSALPSSAPQKLIVLFPMILV